MTRITHAAVAWSQPLGVWYHHGHLDIHRTTVDRLLLDAHLGDEQRVPLHLLVVVTAATPRHGARL